MICLQNHYFFENTDHDVSFYRTALHIFTNTVKSLTDNILFPFYSHFRFFCRIFAIYNNNHAFLA